MSDQLAASRRPLRVEFRGDPAAWQAYFATIHEAGRAYKRTGYANMGPREQRLYRHWTPQALLAHLAQASPLVARSRPRERRAGRAHSTRAGPSDDPDLPRACGVCGRSLEGKRRHARTCGSRCRVAKHRRAALTAAERAALDRRYEAALRIVRRLPHEERVSLLGAVVWPTDARLREAA